MLKWIYSLYAKNNNHLPELKEVLLKRHHKAIKIITTKKIIHTITYKIIDDNKIQINVAPSNNEILDKIKSLLQVKTVITPTHIQAIFDTNQDKEQLKKLLDSTKLSSLPYTNKYNKLQMNNFLLSKEKIAQPKQLTPIQNAYLILEVNEHNSISSIKKQYKKLAKRFHPDKVYSQNSEVINSYTQKFQTILGAYQTILKRA